MNQSHHYTVYKIGLNESLSHKEHLNADELDQWMHDVYGRFAKVMVIRDDGRYVVYTDNGSSFEKIKRGDLSEMLYTN
jgi:hypothetical protein